MAAAAAGNAALEEVAVDMINFLARCGPRNQKYPQPGSPKLLKWNKYFAYFNDHFKGIQEASPPKGLKPQPQQQVCSTPLPRPLPLSQPKQQVCSSPLPRPLPPSQPQQRVCSSTLPRPLPLSQPQQQECSRPLPFPLQPPPLPLSQPQQQECSRPLPFPLQPPPLPHSQPQQQECSRPLPFHLQPPPLPHSQPQQQQQEGSISSIRQCSPTARHAEGSGHRWAPAPGRQAQQQALIQYLIQKVDTVQDTVNRLEASTGGTLLHGGAVRFPKNTQAAAPGCCPGLLLMAWEVVVEVG
ncbi:hypothetical protein V8C86DRAFT_3094988 [Haematococcus lacustris]